MLNSHSTKDEKVPEFYSAIPSNNNSAGSGDGTIVLSLPREPGQEARENFGESVQAESGPLSREESSPLTKEELMRRRDMKTQAKNEQQVLAMEQ